MTMQPEKDANNSKPLQDALHTRHEIEEALQAVRPMRKYLPPDLSAQGNNLMLGIVQILFLEEAMRAWDHKKYEEAARMFAHARDILEFDPNNLLRAYHDACKRREPPRSRGIDPP